VQHTCVKATPLTSDVEQSPCDDMESLGYVLLYFLRGSLPWQSLQDKTEEEEKMILDRKLRASELHIFDGVPVEFKTHFEYVGSEKDLDYGYLRRLFRNPSTAKTLSMITFSTGLY
jgi:hypothetical protein